ncbi:hypothetical protein IPJ72_07155 [Candidatus Peregrinibacteria bacterium]|nr:MAG: hypothetical protein IPJ72_07155 [Candidatus Peregrinibacteria bacterium]
MINCGEFPAGTPTKEGVVYFVCQDTNSAQCLFRKNFEEDQVAWSAFYDLDGHELDRAEAREFDGAPLACGSVAADVVEAVIQ